MNIQTLLSEIKQAKKRRVILDYHPSPVSGVDVMAIDWKPSLVLLHSLFKSFKANNCSITITWWGQIFIIPKHSHTAFELAVNYQVAKVDIPKFDVLTNKQHFIRLRLTTPKPVYTVSLKAHRTRTKWYCIPFDLEKGAALELAASLYKEMLIKVKRYPTPGLEVKKHTSSNANIAAIIHYGAAKFGVSSPFYRLSKTILNPLISAGVELIERSVIIKSYYPRRDTEFRLGYKEHKFFKLFLPN